MATVDERIEAHALLNAVRFGKAIPGKVIPKILGEFPEEKENIQDIMKKINEIVDKVNKLSKEQAQEALETVAPELLEKKEQPKKELPELKNAVQGKIVTRLPPEPSKYNHLGHALTFLINSHYAEKYGGKLILRFEDANPDKVSQEFVDMMTSDIKDYLGIHVDETEFVSNHMPKLLEYAKKLIDKNGAYMCFCPQDLMRMNRREGVACDCRDNELDEQLITWNQFVRGEYKPGECVLRFKGNMTNKNTVLRDPVLWRMSDTEHFRVGKKYHVWPLYDFYSPIEEHLCGVTHIIRSNEFDLRVELQHLMQELLELPTPETLHYGRFNIKGATTKGREIREGIESGKYIGWDDPRLVTLQALKRRGIQAGAYRTLVQQLGLSPHPVTLDFSMLAAANRDIIDPIANRYSFIDDPVEIIVRNAPEEKIEQHLHPDRKDGCRLFNVNEHFYVRTTDVEHFREAVRLKDHCTFDVKDTTYVFRTKEHNDKSVKVINWLPADEKQIIPVEIMMPDATIRTGLSEKNIKNLNVDDVIQFERFGFCRLDKKGDVYKFWYTHD